MADETQVGPDTEAEKKMTAKEATQFAFLFALLSTTGIDKGDTERYKETINKVFTESLEGFGYQIVPK